MEEEIEDDNLCQECLGSGEVYVPEDDITVPCPSCNKWHY